MASFRTGSWLPIVAVCLAGCHQAAPATIIAESSLRSHLGDLWAKKIDPPLASHIAAYRASRAKGEPRGAEFQMIAFRMSGEAVSGDSCIDILGKPDLYLIRENGHMVLVYFFLSNPEKRHMALHILVDSTGQAVQFGWNDANVNDYRQFQPGN
jgi:hypothetical protein